MSRFAERTTVSPEKSRLEIERVLARYGASNLVVGNMQTGAVVIFEMCDRRIRFDLPMPSIDSPEITRTKAGIRPAAQRKAALEQSIRQKWRALGLVIKAKLESVESGITLFEEEFLAHIVLPGGQTVGQWMLPQVAKAYDTGSMPPLLEGPGGNRG